MKHEIFSPRTEQIMVAWCLIDIVIIAITPI